VPGYASLCSSAGPEPVTRPGRLAQRESASFTPRRSLVRSQYRPRDFGVPCACAPGASRHLSRGDDPPGPPGGLASLGLLSPWVGSGWTGGYGADWSAGRVRPDLIGSQVASGDDEAFGFSAGVLDAAVAGGAEQAASVVAPVVTVVGAAEDVEPDADQFSGLIRARTAFPPVSGAGYQPQLSLMASMSSLSRVGDEFGDQELGAVAQIGEAPLPQQLPRVKPGARHRTGKCTQFEVVPAKPPGERDIRFAIRMRRDWRQGMHVAGHWTFASSAASVTTPTIIFATSLALLKSAWRQDHSQSTSALSPRRTTPSSGLSRLATKICTSAS
jgi:hypothetical protein